MLKITKSLLGICTICLFASFTNNSEVSKDLDDFTRQCCTKTATSGEPGTDNYTSLSYTACEDSPWTDSVNMDRACSRAQSTANHRLSYLAPN